MNFLIELYETSINVPKIYKTFFPLFHDKIHERDLSLIPI